MVFCKDCKHYKRRVKYNELFCCYNKDEKCALEIKIDYIPHPIEGYEKKITINKTLYDKNYHCDCPDYKVKWWKALFIKNVKNKIEREKDL